MLLRPTIWIQHSPVRLALGASRWDIARQLIVESVLLSTLGGAVGCWFASYGLQSYAAVANPPTRSWAEHLLDFSLDWRAWLYAAGISLATGLVFGLVAASRFLRFDVDARLKDAGRGIADDRGTRRLSATLVIVQLALSVVLVSGATAMFRSFLALYTADIGASTHDVVTGLINLPPRAYRDASARRSFFARLTANLQNEPGVESVTIASTYPASGGQRVTCEVSGESVGDDRQRPTTSAVVYGVEVIHFRGNTEPEEVSVRRTVRIGHVVAAIVCLGFVFGVSVDWIGHAQQPAAPAVAPQPPTGIPIEAAGFVGKTATLETTGYSVGRRIFAPGSHNATWHMHTAGQLIFAESGHGRFQIKGQPIHELAPGDSGYIPPGVMHWHGSVPNESFTMTFITMGASTTSQGEALTEDVYLGRK